MLWTLASSVLAFELRCSETTFSLPPAIEKDAEASVRIAFFAALRGARRHRGQRLQLRAPRARRLAGRAAQLEREGAVGRHARRRTGDRDDRDGLDFGFGQDVNFGRRGLSRVAAAVAASAAAARRGGRCFQFFVRALGRPGVVRRGQAEVVDRPRGQPRDRGGHFDFRGAAARRARARRRRAVAVVGAVFEHARRGFAVRVDEAFQRRRRLASRARPRRFPRTEPTEVRGVVKDCAVPSAFLPSLLSSLSLNL